MENAQGKSHHQSLYKDLVERASLKAVEKRKSHQIRVGSDGIVIWEEKTQDNDGARF